MKQTATVEQYSAAFTLENEQQYPMAEAFENSMGYAIGRSHPGLLEDLARPLACPVKTNPPNWQHGRILYAIARAYLEKKTTPSLLLDIGTAKGFSALILAWALFDAKKSGRVVSIDMIEPTALVVRNSVYECERGPLTLAQFTGPQRPPGIEIEFLGGGSMNWLYAAEQDKTRVHLAFVDGKHNRMAVKAEGDALSRIQHAGDVILFDDMQIPEVAEGVNMLPRQDYTVSVIELTPRRKYCLARRK